MFKNNQCTVIRVICVISFLLYYNAPYEINQKYCSLLAILYLIEAYYICRIDWINKLYISFNTLFSLSFFLTSFGFAVFVNDFTRDALSVLSGKVVDFKLMPKCCSLCLMAYSLYSISYLKRIEIRQNDFMLNFQYKNTHLSMMLFYTSFFILFIKSIVFFRTTGEINMNEDTFLVSIFECALPVALILNLLEKPCNTLYDFLRNNKKIIIPTFLMIFLYLIMGDRGLIIICAVTILIVYCIFVSKIKFKTMGLIGVVGVMLMFAIRQTRVSDNALSSSSFSSFATASNNAFKEANGVISLFADLTGTINELCLGYEYTEKYGLLYPEEQLIMLPTYPFPLLPSLVASVLFDKKPTDYGTGERLNYYVSDVGNGAFGNSVVIDIYMRWGIVGVMLVFSIFGYCLAFITNKSKSDIRYLAIYIVLTGLAIYTPRNTIPFLIRPIAYSYFFMSILIRKKHIQ